MGRFPEGLGDGKDQKTHSCRVCLSCFIVLNVFQRAMSRHWVCLRTWVCAYTAEVLAAGLLILEVQSTLQSLCALDEKVPVSLPFLCSQKGNCDDAAPPNL
jgi:hypothetical protein